MTAKDNTVADKLKDYDALSKHNIALIADLKEQYVQLREKDAEIERLNNLILCLESEVNQRGHKINDMAEEIESLKEEIKAAHEK